MQLSTYQQMFLRELYVWGGVSVKFWGYAGHYAGILDREIYEQALARICNTDRFNPGNIITAELLAAGPQCPN